MKKIALIMALLLVVTSVFATDVVVRGFFTPPEIGVDLSRYLFRAMRDEFGLGAADSEEDADIVAIVNGVEVVNRGGAAVGYAFSLTVIIPGRPLQSTGAVYTVEHTDYGLFLAGYWMAEYIASTARGVRGAL